MRVLFVNCCIRGETSRTLTLCRAALEEIEKKYPGAEVEELVLDEEGLQPLNSRSLAQRQGLEEAGDFDDPMFRYAHQFARADFILMGAPYWEFQFPALLRVYLEHISVCGVTFTYGEDGRLRGLCQAKRLFYVTTAGGVLEDRNLGFNYVKILCGGMFRIPEITWSGAEGLDIWETDVPKVLEQAEADLRQQVRSWK